MIVLFINWCYMLVLSFITGYSVLRYFECHTDYRIKRPDACLMAGFLVFTVYAQGYSLFAGVGLAANLLLLLVNFCLALWQGRRMRAFLKSWLREAGKGRLAALAALFVLFLYGASRGWIHFDTGLYHAQAIRWVEEYGVVPGLGNLHSRFGYNSAAFPLTALFSMKWLFGQSLHGVAGFLAWVLAAVCLEIRNPFAGLFRFPARKDRPLRVSDFARAAAIVYLTVIFREMVSPASDYFTMLLIFYILIRWLDALERREEGPAVYALLSLLTVLAVTFKLSAAVLCLLAVKPAVQLIRQKKWKDILCYIGLGMAVAAPYLIRGVLISGWLFYPFTFCDWFPVDWKIEKGYADSDAAEIQVYAKLIYDTLLYKMPLSGWVPNWFVHLKGLEKVWVLGSAASVPAAAAGFAVRGLRGSRGCDCGGTADGLLVEGTLIACLAVWFFGAPLMRYGYVYVLLLPFITFGGLWIRLGKAVQGRTGRDWAAPLFTLFLLALLAYKGYNLMGDIRETISQPYYLRQQDYGSYEAKTYEVNGVTIYVPVRNGQIGYDKFPSSPWVQNIELRGKELKDGFRKRG